MSNTAEYEWIKARILMLKDLPMWGRVALLMPLIECHDIPTTAVNPQMHFLYNEEYSQWLTKLDRTGYANRVFHMGHEVGHLFQGVFNRKPENADPLLWNLAADHFINTQLLECGFQSTPYVDSLLPKETRAKVAEYKYIEPYYFYLLNNPDAVKRYQDSVERALKRNGIEPPEGGCTCQTTQTLEKEGGLSEKELRTALDKQRSKVLSALEEAARKGNLPGTLGAWYADITKPSVRWTDYIRLVAVSSFKDRYVFTKPSRRPSFVPRSRLPAMIPETKSAAVFIDTSGSVFCSGGLINQIFSETVAILKACKCPKIFVGLHDTEVYSFGELNTTDLTGGLKIAAGGTSHREVFEILLGTHKKYKFTEPPAMVIMFTDLESDQMSMANPGIPVLWGVAEQHQNYEVPFGQKVVLDF